MFPRKRRVILDVENGMAADPCCLDKAKAKIKQADVGLSTTSYTLFPSESLTYFLHIFSYLAL